MEAIRKYMSYKEHKQGMKGLCMQYYARAVMAILTKYVQIKHINLVHLKK